MKYIIVPLFIFSTFPHVWYMAPVKTVSTTTTRCLTDTYGHVAMALTGCEPFIES